MTPKQALALLDQAIASVNTSREGHQRLIEAVQIISREITTEPTEENVGEQI